MMFHTSLLDALITVRVSYVFVLTNHSLFVSTDVKNRDCRFVFEISKDLIQFTDIP